jgi:hypothetical protein
LHVIEELLDALEDDDSENEMAEVTEPNETVLAVGHSVLAKEGKRRTMRLCGQIDTIQVLILVDSGSVGTFISQHSCDPDQFIAADGSPMICDQRIEKLKWSCQGHSFISNVGILPLKCFDMILGEDWLEDCSPMWVYWSKKLMKFTHQGSRILLKGLTQEVTACSLVATSKLKALLKRQAVSHCL